MTERANSINAFFDKLATSGDYHSAGGHARWGNSAPREARGQVAVSRSLVDAFFAAYPPEHRRAGADFGILHAIDHAAEVIAFHNSFKEDEHGKS